MSRTVQRVDLDVLQNPDQMRAVFQQYLQAPGTPPYLIESCTVDLIRQASARCLLQYTVHLREPSTGEARRQVITGVAYSGDRAERMWERIRLSGAALTGPMPGSGLPAITYVPELQLILQTFPYDFRLPALFRLVNEPPAEVVSLILAEFGPGDWRLETWEAETVRYRVDMRAMVRLAVRARESARNQMVDHRLYAKIYAEEEVGAEAFAIQKLLWDHTATDTAPFVVARPVAYLSDRRTVLLDEVPGTSLLDVLRHEDEALPAVGHTARAFAALHQLPLAEFLAGRSRDVRDERARADRLADALGEAAPELTPMVNEVVTAIGAALGEDFFAPTHFDLKPGHILIEGGRVALLDFDKLAAADPLVDVAGFAVNLGKARGGARRQPEKARAITQAFVAEYFTQVPAGWYGRFPAHYAVALLAEAANSGRGQRGRAEKSGRTDRMAALVQEAHESMMGHLW